jgi:hypothetical protein
MPSRRPDALSDAGVLGSAGACRHQGAGATALPMSSGRETSTAVLRPHRRSLVVVLARDGIRLDRRAAVIGRTWARLRFVVVWSVGRVQALPLRETVTAAVPGSWSTPPSFSAGPFRGGSLTGRNDSPPSPTVPSPTVPSPTCHAWAVGRTRSTPRRGDTRRSTRQRDVGYTQERGGVLIRRAQGDSFGNARGVPMPGPRRLRAHLCGAPRAAAAECSPLDADGPRLPGPDYPGTCHLPAVPSGSCASAPRRSKGGCASAPRRSKGRAPEAAAPTRRRLVTRSLRRGKPSGGAAVPACTDRPRFT